MLEQKLFITECPRDAMQGWKNIIPTDQKIEYLNQLLQVGFDVLDFGSYVNPKVMPQMADTQFVLEAIQDQKGSTELLAIIANLKGAEQASQQKSVDILGFPFSISETFQQRNTNKGIEESFEQVKAIQDIVTKTGQKLLIYISMGFGNPYGDDYSPSIVADWVGKLTEIGIHDFALSDTVGVSNPELIDSIFKPLIAAYKNVRIGAHFHSTPMTAFEKIKSAYDAGCRRFDTSINGIGGCPMAKDELVGNLATESILQFAETLDEGYELNNEAFVKAQEMAQSLFK